MLFEYSAMFPQNIMDQYPHIVSGITSIYFQLLGSAEPIQDIILHAFYTSYSQVSQDNALRFARVCCIPYSNHFNTLKRVFDMHPQLEKPALSAQHYAYLAKLLLGGHLTAEL